MKTYQEDLQQALMILIDKYNHTISRMHWNVHEDSDTRDVAVGSIAIRFSECNPAEIAGLYYEFSISDSKGIICRGILGQIRFLFAKQYQNLRGKIITENAVRGILAIRDTNLKFPPISMMLFEKEDVSTWLASCDSLQEAAAFLLGVFPANVNVYYTDSLSPTNLLPEFYNKELLIIDETLQKTETKSLEELAEIIPGKSAWSYDYRDNGIPYLRSRDIQKGRIVSASVCLEPEKAVEFSRQLLQEGDILLTKHFGQRKLALVTVNDLPAIASEALYIIRPFGISEKYLYRYLTSNTGNVVFNEQLKRIETGSIVASISLSNLKQIRVPIYDEETMQNIEQIDALTGVEGIEAALRIIQGSGIKTEVDIGKYVYNELISAGWNESQIAIEPIIQFDDGRQWRPDIQALLSDGTKVYFEVKRFLSDFSSERVSAIWQILQSETKSYVVLTTGYYYEIHVSRRKDSLKIIHVPTIEEIINWERGLN